MTNCEFNSQLLYEKRNSVKRNCSRGSEISFGRSRLKKNVNGKQNKLTLDYFNLCKC